MRVLKFVGFWMLVTVTILFFTDMAATFGYLQMYGIVNVSWKWRIILSAVVGFFITKGLYNPLDD